MATGLFSTLAIGQAGSDTRPPALEEPSVRKADPVRMRSALDAFREQNGASWRCQWDDRTGLARYLRKGRTPVPGAGANPAAAASVFLADARNILGLSRPIDTLVHAETRPMVVGHGVEFQQRHRGIPVFESTVVVVLDSEHAITQVSSTVWPVGELDTRPQRLAKEAEGIAVRSHGRQIVVSDSKPELVIMPRGEGILAWKVMLSVGPQRLPWRHLIDARTGAILERVNLTACQHGHAPPQQRMRASLPPAPPHMPFGPPMAPPPCEREWVLEEPAAGEVKVESVLAPEYTYWVTIDVGVSSENVGEEDIQIESVYGAGITLLPGIDYEIEVLWSGSTWDSYNPDKDGPPDGIGGTGHWDVFFATINSTGFFWDVTDGSPIANCQCSDGFVENSPVGPGQLWAFGGDFWGNGELCTSSGSRTFTYREDDLAETVYLSLGLDTGRTGSIDGLYPSWGRYEVKISANTPYFNPNPVVTLNDATLVDDGDSNEAVPINGYVIGGELPRLDSPGAMAPYQPIGDYCKVEDVDAPATDPVYSHDKRFPFLRDCDGFEAVNCYLHITQYQEYLQSLGYTGAKAINDRPISVDAHSGGADNSFYAPDGNGTGRLAFGDGGVDDGEDADVIVHEYAHACFDNVHIGVLSGNGGNGSNETRAMNEGAADFLAADYFADESTASGFNPAVFAEWDAESASGLRRLDLDLKYPADIGGSYHNNGQIFSRALWDIRGDVGGGRTIRLLIEAIKALPNNPKFTDMALRMLEVDLGNGPSPADVTAIKEAFLDRGIFRMVRVRAEDSSGNAINGQIDITVTEEDVDGEDDGQAGFDRVYPYNQELTLTAPVNPGGGRTLVGWRLELGGIEPGSDAGPVTVKLDQVAIPAGGYLVTAIYDVVLTGDFDGDGSVSGSDLGSLLALFGAPVDMFPEYDLNGDGSIDGGDIGILLANWTG